MYTATSNMVSARVMFNVSRRSRIKVGSGKTNMPTMPTIKPASAMSANRLMFVTRAPDRMSLEKCLHRRSV